MKQINIYVTVSAKNDDKTGLFGYVMEYTKKDKSVGTVHGIGKDAEASKNRLYILALKEALERIHEPCEIVIISDNAMMRGTLGKDFAPGWIDNWILNNFTNYSGKKVLNADLWELIHNLIQEGAHTITAASDEMANPYNEWLMHEMKCLVETP